MGNGMENAAENIEYFRKLLQESGYSESYFSVKGAYVTTKVIYDSSNYSYVNILCRLQGSIDTSSGEIVSGTGFNLRICREKPTSELLLETGALGYVTVDSRDHQEYSFSSLMYLGEDFYDELYSDIKKGTIPSRIVLGFALPGNEGIGYKWDLGYCDYGLVRSISLEFGDSSQRFRGDFE